MATLHISIKADNRGGKTSLPILQSIVNYTRIVREGGTDANGNKIDDETGPKQKQALLPAKIDTEITIGDYAETTLVSVAISDSQGSVLISFRNKEAKLVQGSNEWKVDIALSADVVSRIIKATTPNKPETKSVISAKAEFKPSTDREVRYKDYSLVVSAVDRAAIPDEKKRKYFGDAEGTISSVLEVGPNTILSDLQAESINSVAVSLQGQFEFTIPILDDDNAWVWVLSGPKSFAGLVNYDEKTKAFRRVLWLPFKEEDLNDVEDEGDGPGTTDGDIILVDPSEQELINSPEIFSDDPGTKCKPFSSPYRIVGEKTFHTVLRVTQPEISADASAPQPPKPFDLSRFYDIDSSEFVLAASTNEPRGTAPTGRPDHRGRLSAISSTVISNISGIRNAVMSLAGSRSATTLSPAGKILAEARADVLRDSQGRRVLDSDKVLDWEDNTPAQAASLSFGHILEYRVRWRNNGYSLGNVLYSLPLAPRQTKQIVTVSSEIIDRARRIESTTASEEIAQGTTRDYGYTDAVQAGLSEWAKGGSKSSQTGAAGGIGLAIGPVVLGGGASHGQAQSSSWQEGGRKVTAIEEQSLRDAIRQYGESVRKLETVVIQEQSQEETTQAVSEVVRNPNYCHTLTIVYHEILRHLRVDTEVVGARECVFVPLPIKPFNWTRMIRWRDSLTRLLMRPRLRWVMPYLEDVRDGFTNSELPEGTRAEQPITFLSGSIYLRLAVERPQDNEDEDLFDRAKWISLSPFVNRPVREIYERLNRNKDQKDQIFQADYAPGIATRWADKLNLKGNGIPLSGVDMTLAGKYRYGQTVRVNFTYVPDRTLNRGDLELLSVGVDTDAALSPGSIANVRRVSIRYTTNDFSREKSSLRSEGDLINVDDGTVQVDGADAIIPLDDWEKKDQRKIITEQANLLKKHLNEHLEHYHKNLWWNMDRDKLYMILDTIYAVSENDGRSVASVVERNPIAILGNNLVYKVAGGAHLGIDGHQNGKELNNYYTDSVAGNEPIRVSLPTAGVYAQALLDDCEACEEHFGSTEWILDDKEPELAALDPSMLSSRRAATPDLTPSNMPASIISLQNAPNVPAPSGVAGALNSVTSSGSFRDMAGLAGTQANSKAAMDTAAELATTFGTQAAEIRKQEIAAKVAKERLDVVKKAVNKGMVSPENAEEQTQKILDQMNTGQMDQQPLTLQEELKERIRTGKSIKASKASPGGLETLEIDGVSPADAGAGSSEDGDNDEELQELSIPEEQSDTMVAKNFLGLDSHGSKIGQDLELDTEGHLFDLQAFGGPEHALLGRSVQRMIDNWALNGLIDGGAFIDTGKDSTPDGRDKSIKDWKIFTPIINSPTNPYAVLDNEPLSHAHWYYIAPNPNGPSEGTPWDPVTLKAHLQTGEAVALSVGQIVMLAGDLYGSFDELAGKTALGKSHRSTKNMLRGIDGDEPWAYGLLSLKAFPDFGPLANDDLAALNLLQTLGSQRYEDHKKAIKRKSSSRYNRTLDLVNYLRAIRGPTGFSEAHVLARTLEKKGKIAESRLREHAPWFNGNHKAHLRNIKTELVEYVVSDGNYLELAMQNQSHFAPDNWSQFKSSQERAFDLIKTHMTAGGASGPIPAEAIAVCAFGLHYLTDAFASGHMRVPRTALGMTGGLASKLAHDFDNEYGLNVENGFGDKWRAFGDGYLDGPSEAIQLEILDKIGALPTSVGISADGSANRDFVFQAIGAAFKQMHYEAERIGLAGASADFDAALENGRKSASELKWEDLAPGQAHDAPDFPGRVQASVTSKIAYMKKHFPTPLPVGPSHAENHPPLYVLQGGQAVIPSGSSYRWYDTMLKGGADRHLQLNWHGVQIEEEFTELWQFEQNIRGNTPFWLNSGTPPDRIYKMITNDEISEETNIIGL